MKTKSWSTDVSTVPLLLWKPDRSYYYRGLPNQPHCLFPVLLCYRNRFIQNTLCLWQCCISGISPQMAPQSIKVASHKANLDNRSHVSSVEFRIDHNSFGINNFFLAPYSFVSTSWRETDFLKGHQRIWWYLWWELQASLRLGTSHGHELVILVRDGDMV